MNNMTRIAPWLSRSALVLLLGAVIGGVLVSGSHESRDAVDARVIMLASDLRIDAASQDQIGPNAGLIAHVASGHVEWTQWDDPVWTDTRVDRLAALFVRSDEGAPTPFIDPGPFTVVWTGQLVVASRTRAGFGADASGAVRIVVNGETVFDNTSSDADLASGTMARLNKGANDIVIRFHGDPRPDNDAFVRTTWHSPKRWQSEPIPPMQFRHATTEASEAGRSVRLARTALARHRCVQCHAVDQTTEDRAMPELSLAAPPLSSSATRLRDDALAAWIHDPKSVRAHARMPRLFPDREDGEIDPRVHDIVAFLTQNESSETGTVRDAWSQHVRPDRVTEGAALFTSLGCVGCHVIDKGDTESDAERLSLRDVHARFRDGAIAAFLLDPTSHDPNTRMPNFALDDDEATALASFLRFHAEASEEPAAVLETNGDPSRGRMLVETMGCLQCHELDGDRAGNRYAAPPMDFVRLTGWDRGCLAPPNDNAARGGAPLVNLTDDERSALRTSGTDAMFASLSQHVASEFAARQIEDQQCIACHRRDDFYDRWTLLEGEIESLHTRFGVDLSSSDEAHDEDEEDGYEGDDDSGVEPMVMQHRPSLTWSGGMLLPDFVESRLSGAWRDKPRPWLTARMPAFAFDASLFARGLAAQHGYSPDPEPRATPDPEVAALGKKLIANGTGFGCTQCHAAGDRPAEAVFEVEGINFDLATRRLRREYFDRWVLQPNRVDPGTRMPQYADEYGKTPLIRHYEGDARQQYDAIWQYLLTLD